MLEPVEPFVDGWVLHGMCEHLEAVTHGKIKRLLMNVPPGFMKSLLTDVFWPAWEWGPMDKAHLRYIAFSYAAHLTERDNGKFLTLLQSRKFQEFYGDRVQLVEQGKVKVSNTRTGYKFASGVEGVGTGERGNRVILDDAHNIKDAESEAIRTSTVQWVREAMSNRLNNIEADAIVAIMQRSHQDDASSVLMDLDYVHFNVPMEYEPKRHCKTMLGWEDPRTFDGELAWPERFSAKAVDIIKRTVGPYAYAGQYQQTPEVRGGAIIKREWWNVWEGRWPKPNFTIAALDSAYTTKAENDPSALTVWRCYTDEEGRPKIVLCAAWEKRLQLNGKTVERLAGETDAEYRQRASKDWGLVDWVADTCNELQVDRLLIEGKASGISVAQEIKRLHATKTWAVVMVDPKGRDKVARAHAITSLFVDGMIYAPKREWAQAVIDQAAAFPKAAHDDLVDSMLYCLDHLRTIGLAIRSEEHERELQELMKPPTKNEPVYEV